MHIEQIFSNPWDQGCMSSTPTHNKNMAHTLINATALFLFTCASLVTS